ncbi:MAG: hypothetical protein K0S65_5486, partial [Labilithrix sp.]|nr:hypothetical protein [Labilithrix sp.]
MTKRRNLILGIVPWVALSSAGFASVVACEGSDDTGRRTDFETPDAGPDVGASLPDSAAPNDAARDVDSAAQRDPFNPADEPVTCAATGPCAKQIVAGRNHFCALLSDGTVRCWGENGLGELGGGDRKGDPNLVTVVDGLLNVTQLSAGGSTTCARRDDGSVHCWGENYYGQLGLSAARPSNDYEPHPTASPVDLAEVASRVDVGERSVCAVVTGNKTWCWGNNERSQLARPDDQGSYVLGPALATTDPLVMSKVVFGSWTVLGLTAAGEVATWGDVAGRDGLLGGRMTSITPDPAPNPIVTLENVTSLVASVTTDRPGSGGGFPPRPPIKLAHACALAAGTVYCWGR